MQLHAVPHCSLSEISGFPRLRFLDGVFLSYFLDQGFVGGRVAESVLSSPCDGVFPSCAWLCWRGLCLCVPFSSSFSPVRILFWVFCWFVLLRGPRVGVFPFLPAEVQGLEHRHGVSSKWAHWQHTLWWVSSPWSGHREAGDLHSESMGCAVQLPLNSVMARSKTRTGFSSSIFRHDGACCKFYSENY